MKFQKGGMSRYLLQMFSKSNGQILLKIFKILDYIR